MSLVLNFEAHINIIYHKNERKMSLVTHIFTKFSRNVCLINAHILIYWYARCHCKLWKVYNFIAFFGYFHILLTSNHIWSIMSSPSFHRSCVWLMYKFWCVNMQNVTASYGGFSYSISFSGNFLIILHFRQTFTNCVLFRTEM